MRLAAIILALSCAASAQYNDNAPFMYESSISPVIGTSGVSIVVPENVAVNDVIVVGKISAGNVAVGYACTDTLGNTFTNTATFQTTGPNIASGDFCYVKSTSAGADTITVANTSPGAGWALHLWHLRGVSATLDGAMQTSNFNGANTTISTSHTTTVNGDFIVALAYPDMFYAAAPLNPAASSGAEYASYTVQGTNPMIGLGMINRAGAIGTVTTTANVSYASGATMNVSMISLAFKPAATIAITTTRLAQGDTGHAYAQCLGAVGGTAALTYSASGFPSGMAFNTATGCFSGTPGSAGSFTVAASVTDGSVTSSTVNLPLVISAAQMTPSVVTSAAFATDSEHSGNFSVQCGDTIVYLAHSFDTHGGEGYILPGNGASNNVTDVLSGQTFHRLESFSGTWNAGIAAYAVQETKSGTTSILVNSNTTGSPLASAYIVLRNVQPWIDLASMASIMPQATTNPFTYSSAYTTTVANELLFKGTATNNNTGTLDGIAFGTMTGLIPAFTSVTSTDTFAVADATVAAAGTTTDTATITVNGGMLVKSDASASLMFALRPAVSNSCTATYLGEKRRRHPN